MKRPSPSQTMTRPSQKLHRSPRSSARLRIGEATAPGHQQTVHTAALNGAGPVPATLIARTLTLLLRAAALRIALALLTAMVVMLVMIRILRRSTGKPSAHQKDGIGVVRTNGLLPLMASAAVRLAGSETSGVTATMVASTPRTSAAYRPSGATSNASSQKESARSLRVIALATPTLTLFLKSRTLDVSLDSPRSTLPTLGKVSAQLSASSTALGVIGNFSSVTRLKTAASRELRTSVPSSHKRCGNLVVTLPGQPVTRTTTPAGRPHLALSALTESSMLVLMIGTGPAQ